MAQVSGSLALDLTKVQREIVRHVADELTRTEPTALEREHGAPVPLDKLARTVSVEVVKSVLPALAEIGVKLNALTELVKAEAARRDRMMVRPDMATAEFRAVREPVQYGPGQGPAWAPEEPAVANVGPYEVVVDPGAPITEEAEYAEWEAQKAERDQ